MGAIGSTIAFIHGKKEIFQEIKNNPQRHIIFFLLGIIIFSAIYGFIYPFAVMKFNEISEVFHWAWQDAIKFPLTFLIAFVTIFFSAMLIMGKPSHTIAIFGALLSSTTMITATCLPILLLTGVNRFFNTGFIIINALVILVSIIYSSIRFYGAIQVIYEFTASKSFVLTVIFTIFLIWALVNAAYLFTYVPYSGYYGRTGMLLSEAVADVTIADKVLW